MLRVVQYCRVSVLCDRPDCDLESLSETPSVPVSKSYHTRDHTYFYDKLGLLSATGEAMSMNYWPVLSRPVSQPLAYFHPLLSSPTVASLAPQVARRTSEFSACFARSPLTASHMNMPPSLSFVRPVLSTSQQERRPAAVRHLRRYSLPTESNVCVEAPLDLTVASCKGLQHISPPEGIRSYHMSTSRLISGAGTSEYVVNLTPNTIRSSDVPFYVTNSSPYVPPPMSRFLSCEPAVSSTVQFSGVGVTVPAQSCNDDMEMPHNGFGVYTVANTCSTASQAFFASADTKPVTADTSLSKHREEDSLSSRLLASYTDPLYWSSADVKPVLTAAVSDGDISDQMSVTVSKVACSVEDSLHPSVVAASLQANINCPGIDQVSIASSTYSGTSTSDAIAQYPQLPEMSERPPRESPSSVLAAVPSSVDSVHSSTFLPSVQIGEKRDSLPPDHEASAGVSKMEVDEQVVVGATGVDIKDDQLLSSASESGSRATSEKVIDENLAVDRAGESGDAALGQSPTRQTFIEPERMVTDEETGRHSTLLNTSLEEHATGVLSKEPSSERAERSNLSEERTDFKPVFDHTSGTIVSENAADRNGLANVEDSGNVVVKIEATGGTPVSDVNRPSTTTSNEYVTASKPDGLVSEPGSAAVAVEVDTQVVSETSQRDTSAVRPNGETDDAIAEADKNQRFNELMLRCTKALELCLTRFPQHYKSLYRLADVFFRCSGLKVSRTAIQRLPQNGSNFSLISALYRLCGHYKTDLATFLIAL